MPAAVKCKNCDKQFDTSFDFCPYCGQEKADKLTFGVLFSNTISNYFSIDARFFKSFLPLMIKPGVLARKFVDGRRLTYLHPAQFYLFISVVFFFLFSFSVRKTDSQFNRLLKEGFQKDAVLDSLEIAKDSIQPSLEGVITNFDSLPGVSGEELEEINQAIDSVQKGPNVGFDFNRELLDSLITNNATHEEKLSAMGLEDDAGFITKRFYEQMLKFYEQQGGGIIQAFYSTIPVAMFFMLPLFAFLLKIFYWKRGIFAHHMVFSFYYFTFLFSAFSLILILSNWINIPWWIHILLVVSYVVYLALALRNFYKSTWPGAVIKSGAVSFVYILLIVPFAFFCAYVRVIFTILKVQKNQKSTTGFFPHS